MGDIGIVETTFFFKGFKSSIAPTGTLGLQLLEAFGFEERCTHELVAELVQTENNVIVFFIQVRRNKVLKLTEQDG